MEVKTVTTYHAAPSTVGLGDAFSTACGLDSLSAKADKARQTKRLFSIQRRKPCWVYWSVVVPPVSPAEAARQEKGDLHLIPSRTAAVQRLCRTQLSPQHKIFCTQLGLRLSQLNGSARRTCQSLSKSIIPFFPASI
jgi:hypothetical protein